MWLWVPILVLPLRPLRSLLRVRWFRFCHIFGLSGVFAMVLSLLFVGAALGFTGGVVGLLSGASPLKRGIRQILIGFGAAFVTYLLGLAFGTTVG